MARYQVMAYGHPASAFSEHIDFGMCDTLGDETDYQRFMLEKLIPIFQNDPNCEPHPQYTPALQRVNINDGVVRIAINSSLAKISPRLVNLCKFLVEHSSYALQFHFLDRKSTRLNSSHVKISYAVFC